MVTIGTRPLQSVLFDSVVFNTRQHRYKFGDFVIPDCLGTVECPFMPQTTRDFLEDPPILFCLTGRRGNGSYPANPSFTVGEGAIFLTPRFRRQDDMGKAGGLIREDILHHQELG